MTALTSKLSLQGQETYSYYGPLNALTYNVGYHNEHHDFPQIPHSRLYRLRQIAPEFYNTLTWHTSWCWIIYKFLTDPEVRIQDQAIHSSLVSFPIQKYKPKMCRSSATKLWAMSVYHMMPKIVQTPFQKILMCLKCCHLADLCG